MGFEIFDNEYEVIGQISLFDCLDTPIYKIDSNKKIRLIELFGGIGSQALSLERLLGKAGELWEHHKLVEFDKYPVASYNAIHGTNFEPTDITKIKGIDLNVSECDRFTYLLTYSFPCQDISTAGLGKSLAKENQENEETRTRSGLLWEVERLLNECKEISMKDKNFGMPQILIMENVKNLLSPKHKPHFDKWCEYLESMGYSNYYKVMNAKNFGVAQNRERVFMVSIYGNYRYEFPKEIELERVMKDYLEDNVDKKYYVTSEKAKTMVDKLILDGKILEQSRAEQSRAEQSRAEQSRAEQSELKIEFAGNMRGQNQGFVGSVYYTDGICPGLRARDYKEPIEVLECKNLSMDQKKILKD